ncbi:GntR family transcriptional regulator [Aquabacter spiritensis]|uniref:GntR family transcriptional regulator n=1 Tax=Aquabacter spiritensis TaxID=933073 RepID=A0A4R3LK03_9HYPH|nr:GntR family transcriptional regulator [Aquabacter spiritensis]TCT00602.1 GntR family transcriptional regulator [Aquabacter spiritensis]
MARAQPADFQTKTQVVFGELKQRILEGSLQPGTRLLLKAVADEFGCSEIPVREAFRSLEARGFVELVPHSGAYVTQLRVEEILDYTHIRTLLEPEANFLAAPLLDKAAIKLLKTINTEMADRRRAKSAARYSELNRTFHRTILGFCPNQKLVANIEDVWDRGERGSQVFKRGPAFVAEATAQHDAMIHLIEQRDFEGFRTLSRQHAQFNLDAIRALMAEAAESAAAQDVPAATASDRTGSV